MPSADILPCCATNIKVKESNSNKWKGLSGKTHLGMKKFVKEKAATEEISQTWDFVVFSHAVVRQQGVYF